jgi:hypothetical protein
VSAPALWLKVSVAFALALAAVYFLPGDDGGATPPTDTLLLVAVTVALIATVAIWLGLRDEQVAIGIGARMGNGLLTSLLAWLVLEAAGASAAERLFFVLALAGLFAASFAALVRRPDVVVIGYKG